MNIKSILEHLIARKDLSSDEMSDVMHQIMTGQTTPAQIAGFLIALRMKGETVSEITAAAKVMRELVKPVTVTHPNLIDIVGTGGDQAHTFNISTASAFVVAAAGGVVAKHGNRSVSSRSGSADVLETAGVNLNLTAAQVAECVNKIGIGFMFAPLHHTAMKHAIGPRKELGVRTIFNLLGPLTNPASTKKQVLGVFDDSLLEPFAEVMQQLGSEHVMVVHSEDGLDEISIAAKTHVAELKNNAIQTYHIDPSQYSMQHANLNALKVTDAKQSLQLIYDALENHTGPAHDIVALNAGAAIYVSGIAENLQQGLDKALHVIKSGKALEKLRELIELSNSF